MPDCGWRFYSGEEDAGGEMRLDVPQVKPQGRPHAEVARL